MRGRWCAPVFQTHSVSDPLCAATWLQLLYALLLRLTFLNLMISILSILSILLILSVLLMLSILLFDTNSIVSEVQDIVYNYFAETCGTMPIQVNQDLITGYANHSIKALKNALRLLKKAPPSSDSSELRYVSAFD